MEINKLIEIADSTKQNDILKKLQELSIAMSSSNAPLVLPLVGEFSSGKTTLINALTDSKKLETATKPTTATIYEVFFGNETCSASVINNDGSVREEIDMENLKNKELKDAAVVEIYDTSDKVASSTVLVDTPGLSSSDPKHKEVLLEFIPKADGILLVTDVNQQITKSLVDFTKNISLTNRPVYLVITKCDTKSQQEIEDVKKYILNNSELKIKDIVCVSANENNLDEVLNLLKTINDDKTSILKRVNEERVNNLAKLLLERINELLAISNNSEGLDEEIKNSKRELDKLINNINRLIDDVSGEITNIESSTCRKFQDVIFDRLESLMASNSSNFDGEAVSIINGASSQLLSAYKTEVQSTLYSFASNRRDTEDAINLQSLADIDYSTIDISDLPYNLNLNELGHEYDGWITGGAKILAVAGLVAATVATAGAAAAAIAPAAAGGAVAAGGAAAVAQGVAGSVDAIVVAGANVVMNKNRDRELQRLRQQEMQRQIQQGMETVENYNQEIGEKVGQKKGLIEGLVSKVTDKTGKPQRQRAIHNYIDDSLLPSFKQQLKTVSQQLINTIRTSLNAEAEELIHQKTENLKELKSQKEKMNDEYKKRVELLTNYKTQLANA